VPACSLPKISSPDETSFPRFASDTQWLDDSQNKGVIDKNMAKFLWTICGFCAATLGFLTWSRKRTPPVELLAHRLEEAWADHHTVV
jgi:hypothetical protein